MANSSICPVETTLDLIGGKYKALILWHLSDGTLRFSELRKMISGATPKMLTQQLRELGETLMPVLQAMRNWGADYLRSKNIEPNCFMMRSKIAEQSN